jgi:hypothetical protein
LEKLISNKIENRIMNIRFTLFFVGLFVAALFAALVPTPATFATCALFVFLIGNTVSRQTSQLCVTYSTTVLLGDIMAAFKVRFPMLFGPAGFGTDFSADPARLNDQIIAKIRTLPAVSTYDGTTGYENGATEASALYVDVPVTLNQHKHVPVKVDYLDQIAARQDLYNGVVSDMAFVLGKSVVDFALGLVIADNFSYGANVTQQNANKDTLDAATKKLNINGCSPIGRFGIVNSGFYNGLEGDSRIASGDYHGQQRTDNAYGSLTNVSGFSRIYEYPDLPTNAQQLNAFFGVSQAIALASRVPADVSKLAARIGIPTIAKFDTLSDPNSGLTLMGIEWMKSGVFDIYTTVVLLYGGNAGRQAGVAGTICDKAGYRVTEAAGVY